MPGSFLIGQHSLDPGLHHGSELGEFFYRILFLRSAIVMTVT